MRSPTEGLSEQTASLIKMLVAPRHGLVTNLSEQNNPDCAPGLFVSWTSAYMRKRSVGGKAGESTLLHGSGIGVTRDRSVMSCLGELIERWAAWDSGFHGTVTAKAKDLDRGYLDPRELIGFSASQFALPGFRYVPFSPDMEITWVEGIRLRDDSPILVPAQAVFLDSNLWNEPQFLQMTSCGMASGSSVSAVIASGMHECIERDAFCARWLLNAPGPRVHPATIDRAISERLREIVARSRCELRVNDLTTDVGIPVYSASLHPRGSLRGVVYGASANVDPRIAIEKAVTEAFQSLCWAVQAIETRNVSAMRPEDIVDYMDHAAYYLDESRADSIEWFSAPHDEGPCDSVVLGDGRTAVERVLEFGLDPVFVDFTNQNLQAIGMRAGRVIVPGLHPLHAGYGLEPQDRRRLDKLGAWLGCSSGSQLNKSPHPFP